MKRTLYVVGGFAAVGVLAATVALAVTNVLPEEADSFFSLIEQGTYAEAYRSTSAAFQHETSEEVFVSFVARTLLTDYARAQWSSRTMENRTGRLVGAVETKGNVTIPVTLEFVKEDAEWKILSMEMGDAGFVRAGGALTIPSGEELIRLTNESIQLLGEAINAREFTGMYAGISSPWRRQTSPPDLHRAFTSFVAQDLDLLPALEAKPVYSRPPALDNDGVLLLEGYYPVDPKPLAFRLEYVYEHPDWKLLGINVRQ